MVTRVEAVDTPTAHIQVVIPEEAVIQVARGQAEAAIPVLLTVAGADTQAVAAVEAHTFPHPPQHRRLLLHHPPQVDIVSDRQAQLNSFC